MHFGHKPFNFVKLGHKNSRNRKLKWRPLDSPKLSMNYVSLQCDPVTSKFETDEILLIEVCSNAKPGSIFLIYSMNATI
jgi:hypothetical protein